jgi:hypothetical protein
MKNKLIYISIFVAYLLPGTSLKAQRANDPASILQRAIETHSDVLMRKFFESWVQASNTLRRKIQTTTQQDAEAIFEAVWNPEKSHLLGCGWTADTIPPRSLPRYIVLSPSVHVRAYKILSDSLRDATHRDYVMEIPETQPIPFDSLYFMAPSHLYGAKTLFYLQEYLSALDKYMRWPDSNYKANTAFISKFVSISCHMLGCVAIGAPQITSIIINQSRDRADVPYRLGETGGTASLSKVKNRWQITSVSMSNMIE